MKKVAKNIAKKILGGKKSLKSEVRVIKRQLRDVKSNVINLIQSTTNPGVVGIGALGGGMGITFVGANTNVGFNTVAVSSFLLTAVTEGTGVGNRSTDVLNFDLIKGRLMFQQITNSPGVDAGPYVYRVIILRIDKMPQDGATPGTYRHPTIAEVMTTTNPTTPADILAPIGVYDELAFDKKNIHKVMDKLVYWQSDAPKGVKVVHFSIRPPKGYKTVYDGNTNATADASRGHYLMYVLQTNAPIITAQPDMMIYWQQRFHV